MPRVDSYSSLTPAWGKSCLLQLHLLHLVDLLLLVNGVPRGQLLVVGSRVEQLVHLASCVQLLVVGPRVGQLVLRNVPRGQLFVVGPRVGLVSRVENLVVDLAQRQSCAAPGRLVLLLFSATAVVVVSFPCSSSLFFLRLSC